MTEPELSTPPSVAPPPAVSPWMTLPSAILVVSAFLPITPLGNSFADLVIDAFAQSPVMGIMMIAGFGSPFVFGLAVAIAARIGEQPMTRRLVRIPVWMMHSQLLLVAIVVWRSGEAAAPWSLLGLAVVGGGYAAYHSAKTYAIGDGPVLAWYVRWGSMLITAVAGWARLQRTVGVDLEIGLDVIGLSAIAMVFIGGRVPVGGAAPEASSGAGLAPDAGDPLLLEDDNEEPEEQDSEM